MLRTFLRNLVSGTLAIRLRRFVIVGALAAGVQTRLPGGEWTERESPFAVDGA